MRATLHQLCRQPRLAGSPEAQLATDYIRQEFLQAGLQVESFPYLVHAPRQTKESLAIKIAAGEWLELNLQEQGFAEDSWSLQEARPPMHGLTKAGMATGGVVFAGFGSEQEFAQLRKKIGGELQNCIALIRYGRLYRGLKVANAEAAGCKAALLYCDPDDDGAGRGKVLPKGKWRTASSIQRGSVFNGHGDPRTPGWASLPDAPRLSLNQVQGLVNIPSLPISWQNAEKIFAGQGRPKLPQALATKARLEIRQDSNPVTITNIVGRIPGKTHPKEWVIVGAHRDSWGPGAIDNGTGTTVLTEIARVFGAAYRAGWQPNRSLVFASWDGEEWGLVGSTEWVEQFQSELRAHAVAYINLDVVASGENFGASCTPGLASFITQTCRQQGLQAPTNLGTPGGGSDHVPFLEWAGIEVAGIGFHGSSGTYHSQMDTPYVVETFLDPDFKNHEQAARFACQLLLSLSSADTIPRAAKEWAQRAREGAGRLRGLQATSPAWLSFFKALDELAEMSAVINYSPALPFHQAFITGDRGSLLWKSFGYGSLWFPTLSAESTPSEVAEVTAALHQAKNSF